MPRFHFTIRDGARLSGEEGRTLPGLHAARMEAVRYAEAFLAGHAREFRTAKEWTLDITDERGAPLFSLALASYDPPELENPCYPDAPCGASVNRY